MLILVNGIVKKMTYGIISTGIILSIFNICTATPLRLVNLFN